MTGLLIRSAIFCIGILGYVGEAFPRLVLVEISEDNRPIISSQPKVEMEQIRSTNGLPNIGFSYGTAGSIEGGVDVKFGRVLPFGKIAAHASEGEYVLCVLSGSGTLIVMDSEGGEVSRVDFVPGDIIRLEPHTFHRWENGPDTWEFFGIKQWSPTQAHTDIAAGIEMDP